MLKRLLISLLVITACLAGAGWLYVSSQRACARGCGDVDELIGSALNRQQAIAKADQGDGAAAYALYFDARLLGRPEEKMKWLHRSAALGYAQAVSELCAIDKTATCSDKPANGDGPVGVVP